MRVLKCDRCGAYYEPKTKGAGRLAFLRGTEKDVPLYADDFKDLCKDCFQKAEDWFFNPHLYPSALGQIVENITSDTERT